MPEKRPWLAMADRIVALERDNARLRAALERIRDAEQQWYVLAREALEPPVEGVPGLGSVE